MSFRLRVLVLTMFIAVTATATTALLTVRQASRQLTRTVTGSRQEVATVAAQLAEYGRDHGTWDLVGGTVRSLAESSGQRVRVVSASGSVLADSDLLAGRAARPVTGPPTLVDPRLVVRLEVPPDLTWPGVVRFAWSQFYTYDLSLRYAACLTAADVPVRATGGSYGVPDHVAAGAASGAPADRCRAAAVAATRDLQAITVALRRGEQKALPRAFGAAMAGCSTLAGARLAGCVQQAFAQQVGLLGPQPVQLYLGAVDDRAPALPRGPIIVGALLVAAAAVLAAWGLSRRVLRPIDALTSASRSLAAGDLSGRVPVRGRDELAELGRAFNRMAGSLQASEERQRRMVADVAHELRTPLANLRGYLEALKDGVLPPTVELFESLHEESLLQQRIVDDLQELALAEAGALTYHRAVINLGELAQVSRTACGPLAEEAGLALTVETEQAYVYADADRLRQVVANLVRNAVAATRPGGVIALRVRTEPGLAFLEVTDTGTGIEADHLPHVCDRFWRADSSRGRGPGGGLGLAIARQIVADHGGTITVASEPGRGTTFTVAVPRALAPTTSAAVSARP
jgi:signal transduction histidine kinase